MIEAKKDIMMILKKTVLFILLSFFISYVCSADTNTVQLWQKLEHSIRDAKIPKIEAKKEIQELSEKFRQHLSILDFESASFDKWIFPLAGYDHGAIDKKGFIIKGYNFFDGNKHGGHPAYDIYIKDKNQDMLDDKTKKPVETRSISSGMVISINTGWKRKSGLRGGNYIYIYDDISNYIFYYAHLNNIFVKTGQLVKAGDIIATLGRSGKNAFPRRSPTHLHLMVLDAKTMQPVDILKRLEKLNN